MMIMINEATIRRAANKDLPEIYRIELDVFGDDAWNPVALGFFLYLDLAKFLVYDNGKVIGYAIGVVERGGLGHVLNIAVRRDYRRKGIGAALLSELEADLEKLCARKFYLEVRADNYSAIRFYEKNGYQISGVKKKYYRNGADALIMVKKT